MIYIQPEDYGPMKSALKSWDKVLVADASFMEAIGQTSRIEEIKREQEVVKRILARIEFDEKANRA